MCDQDSMNDALEYHLKSTGLSRRQFGALGLGAGFVALLPPVANAAEVTETEVTIKTADGQCDAYFVHPAKGAHPAVLVWPDIFGLRASFRQMGRRLAESGYSVLVINPFYRTKKAPTSPDHADFSDPATRGSLMALMGSLNADTVAGALAAALGAEKLIFLTDVDGIRSDASDPSSRINQITLEQAPGLFADGTVSGGMIPKLEACVLAVQAGVARAHVLDGRNPHALLVELFTDAGVGTMVRP